MIACEVNLNGTKRQATITVPVVNRKGRDITFEEFRIEVPGYGIVLHIPIVKVSEAFQSMLSLRQSFNPPKPSSPDKGSGSISPYKKPEPEPSKFFLSSRLSFLDDYRRKKASRLAETRTTEQR